MTDNDDLENIAIFYFPTERETLAFRKGIEYVNDPAVTVKEVRNLTVGPDWRGWKVVVEDLTKRDRLHSVKSQGDDMKTYKVLVEWTMVTTLFIEAESKEDAIKDAQGRNDLPKDGEYMDDSYRVHDELVEVEGE